jgi:hypothetical protein
LATAGVDKKTNMRTAMILIPILLRKKNPLVPPRLAQNISTGLSRGFITILKLYFFKYENLNCDFTLELSS